MDIFRDRAALQRRLDAERSPQERNQRGQYSTPESLARAMARYAIGQLAGRPLERLLEPAFGTGALYAAMCQELRASPEALAFEIDPHYGIPARQLWRHHPIDLRIQDFTVWAGEPRHRASLLLGNPPYVRNQHLSQDEKQRLRTLTAAVTGEHFSGLSGLHTYFVALAGRALQPDNLAGWILPAETFDVGYGTALKQFLVRRCTLLHLHYFNPRDPQFPEALVASAVLWMRYAPPPPDHQVRLTFGGALDTPALERREYQHKLDVSAKWSRNTAPAPNPDPDVVRVGDLFTVRRGLETGANDFFILSGDRAAAIPGQWRLPILPSPRALPGDIIYASASGTPRDLPPRYLFSCDLSEEAARASSKAVAELLDEGRSRGIHLRDTCRCRTPWFRQERRAPAPLLLTYMGRGRKGASALRFILNESMALAPNVYLLLYPRPLLQPTGHTVRTIWEHLRSSALDAVLGEGRIYGGGLAKIEPRELMAVQLPGIRRPTGTHQREMTEELRYDLVENPRPAP